MTVVSSDAQTYWTGTADVQLMNSVDLEYCVGKGALGGPFRTPQICIPRVIGYLLSVSGTAAEAVSALFSTSTVQPL